MRYEQLGSGAWIRWERYESAHCAGEGNGSPAADSWGDPIGCGLCSIGAPHTEALHRERLEADARRWASEQTEGYRVLSDRVVTVRGIYHCAHCRMEHAHGDHMRVVRAVTRSDGILETRSCAYGCSSHGRAA